MRSWGWRDDEDIFGLNAELTRLMDMPARMHGRLRGARGGYIELLGRPAERIDLEVKGARTFDRRDLHIIAVMSNPVRWRSRARLARNFLERMECSGHNVTFVEATFADYEPEVADRRNPNHLVVKAPTELWQKENLLNIARRHLPPTAKYLMWCDADVGFGNEAWAEDVLDALQVHPVVQPFSHVVDYGAHGEVLEMQRSFFFCFRKGFEFGAWKYSKGPFWHPGYACAWRADAWDHVAGVFDRGIAGSGDFHMACALIGQASFSIQPGLHPHYAECVQAWEDRAREAVDGNVGYVLGTIHHHYHGPKADRRYPTRWKILVDHQFDPLRDVHYDRHGVLMLSGNKPELRDALMAYHRQRNEDA